MTYCASTRSNALNRFDVEFEAPSPAAVMDINGRHATISLHRALGQPHLHPPAQTIVPGWLRSKIVVEPPPEKRPLCASQPPLTLAAGRAPAGNDPMGPLNPPANRYWQADKPTADGPGNRNCRPNLRIPRDFDLNPPPAIPIPYRPPRPSFVEKNRPMGPGLAPMGGWGRTPERHGGRGPPLVRSMPNKRRPAASRNLAAGAFGSSRAAVEMPGRLGAETPKSSAFDV